MRLPPLPSMREVLKLYKIGAQKRLSQNFLMDMNLTKKIVRKAGKLAGKHVCEVGPGPGGITRALLEKGVQSLHVVEKDARFIPSLDVLHEATDGIVIVHHDDILKFDMTHLFDEELCYPWEDKSPPIHIIGNLPFSISTPLIVRWLQDIANKEGAWRYGRVPLTLTFQKEVCERLVAPMSDAQRSRLSIMSQAYCYVEHHFTIPGKAFSPPPEVDVGVVTLTPRIQPLVDTPFMVLEKLVKHIFHFRQKQCKRGAQTLYPADRKDLLLELFSTADVDPTISPTRLHMEEFKRLAVVYAQQCERDPDLLDFDYRSKEHLKLWRSTSRALPF